MDAASQLPSPQADPPSDLTSILALAARGWRVFPCWPRSKTPRVQEWQRVATTDQGQIRAWHEKYPASNWAIAAGKKSNLFSIDGDTKPCPSCPPEEQSKTPKDGKTIIRRLVDEHGIHTLTLRTQHGGQLLFEYPPDMEIRNEQDGHTFGEGVDIRGEGGYFMAPGSIHPEGSVYSFWKPEVPPATAPESLLAVIRSRQKRDGPPGSIPEGRVPKGRRHHHLLSLAGTMLCRKMAPVAIEAALQAENQARCDPPYPDAEVSGLVKDAVKRYGPGGLAVAEGFSLTSLAELLKKPDLPVEYVWDGRLVAGTISVAVAKPKVGKSTFSRNLSLAVARGEDFLGWPTRAGEVVYLALEERENEVRRDFKALGADGTEPIQVHAAATPAEGMFLLVDLIRERKPRLVVIDPLIRLVHIKDENKYAEMYTALGPLIDVARETDTHVLLNHHAGKGQKTDPVEAPLGTQGIGGAICTLVLLKRGETYRTISTVQRVGDDLDETVLQFDLDTRRLTIGETKAVADRQNSEKNILEFLRDAGGPQTQAQIRDAVEGRTRVIRAALTTLLAGDKVAKSGLGTKGKPFLYEFPNSGSLYIVGTREPECKKVVQAHESVGNNSGSKSSENLSLFQKVGNQHFEPQTPAGDNTTTDRLTAPKQSHPRRESEKIISPPAPDDGFVEVEI